MQHYLEDGIEIIDVIFNKEDVEAYKKILPIKKDAPSVPVLYLASIWPKFSLFERFLEKEIYLKETSVDEFKALDVDTVYKAKLENEKIKKVKSFMIYEFSLTITSGNDIYIRLKQIFVGK
ncbi:protein vraC [Mammaliicoccus sciuri]|uniref:protein vraC n=1 Tax=Mammaliicoccus sciuri TaxID=1296 RepID=UPI001FB2C56D|nr:protein vraC [Mammaliicoccus sciuri]MCJ1777913.1 protein vraC [Mammaliicoccus sciuri]